MAQFAQSEAFAKRCLTAIALAMAAISLLWLVREVVEILLIIFAGVLLGVFLHGVSHFLAKALHAPYRLMLAVVVLLLLGLAAGVVAYTAPHLADQINKLSAELGTAGESLRAWMSRYPWLERTLQETPGLGTLLGGATPALQSATHIFTTTFGLVANVLIIAFTGLYTALSPRLYTDGLVRLVPPARREGAEHLLEDMRDKLWWWLIGRLVSMAIIGVFTALGLWLMGIPLPIMLGLLAALLSFIPNIGPIIAVVPPMILAWQFGWNTVLYVAIFYAALQLVESYFITPLVQKRAIDMPPALLLGAQVVLATVAGPIGLVVAAPLTAVAILLVRELYIERLEEKSAGA